MNEQARKVLAFLRESGASDVRLEMGGKHPRAVYSWHGTERFYVLPGTPGDTMRGSQNAISDLRHHLGLTKAEKTIGARRVRKNYAEKPALELPCEITVRPHFASAILSHPSVTEKLPAMRDAAFLKYWQACLREAGGRSVLTSFGAFQP